MQPDEVLGVLRQRGYSVDDANELKLVTDSVGNVVWAYTPESGIVILKEGLTLDEEAAERKRAEGELRAAAEKMGDT